MKLIIENKIKLNVIPLKDFTYLKNNNIYFTNLSQKDGFTVLEQKCNLPNSTLTKVMQIIEWFSKEPLVITWFPDSKFYMYTQKYFFDTFKKDNWL